MKSSSSAWAPSEHPDPPTSSRVLEARARLLANIDRISLGGSTESPGGGLESDDPSYRYTVGEMIASGGFGIIHRAYDRRLRREVALKVPRLTSPTTTQRLLREAALTARLDHPGIISIHDVGRLGEGQPFYCMSLVEGGTLVEAVSMGSTLKERLHLLERVLAVADAVAYAHHQGIVHRDLKPANVLLGAQGETVIIDWGLAKICDASVDEEIQGPRADGSSEGAETERGAVLGTLHYMAPEQARGEPIDVQADVFALGAVLFHVLAGRPPYAEPDRSALLGRVRDGAIDELTELVPEVPRDLAALVSRAMDPRRACRYANAEGLAADLRSFLTGHVVNAHDYRLGELFRLWVRRNLAVAQVAAVASVVLLIASVTFVASLREETARAREAEAGARAAEELAEARAELALLAQARSVMDDDPDQALSILRQLSMKTNQELRRARQIANAAASRDRPDRVIYGHSGNVRSIAALAGGGVVSVDATGSVWRWDLDTGDGEEVLDLGAPDGIVIAAADASTWAALTDEVGYVIRDEGAPEAIDIGLLRGIGGSVEATLARDGSTLLVRSGRGGVDALPGIRGWDLRGPAPRRHFALDGQASAALSPDGETIAVGHRDYGATLISPYQHGSLLSRVSPRAFSGDGEHLVGTRRGDLKTVVYSLHSGAVDTFGDKVVMPVDDEWALVHGLARAHLPLLHDYRIALRSLRTGEERWAFPLSEFANREVLHSLWGHGQRVVLDERCHRFALALAGAWRVYSLRDGALLRRLDVASSVGAFAADCTFVDGDGDELRVWRSPVPSEHDGVSPLAVASDGSVSLSRAKGGPFSLNRDGVQPRVLRTAGCDGRPVRHVLVNPRGDALIATQGGYCILAKDATARRVDTALEVSAAALASSADAHVIGTEDGMLLLTGPGGTRPRPLQLPEKIVGLWIEPRGASTYAATQGGALYRIHGDGPPVLLAKRGDRAHVSIGAALHPSQDLAAFVFPTRDRVLVFDGELGTTSELALSLSEVPVAAYSRAGRLAVATADESVTILGPGERAPQTLSLPSLVTGLAFADETILIAATADGALMRLDLVIEDGIILRDGWTRASPSAIRLSVRSDGAVFGLRSFEWAFLPPRGVPHERRAFAEWLATTTAHHRRG